MGHDDVDMHVSVIRTGAFFDFIEKPCDRTRLLASIRNAVEQYRKQMSSIVEVEQLRSRFSSLSPRRQHQVMELIVEGLLNKEIGMRLHLSAKTVDNHRAWVMERVGARNLAELVRMATTIQGRP
jgi:two-component system, LuxR family, response regulator FixJ